MNSTMNLLGSNLGKTTRVTPQPDSDALVFGFEKDYRTRDPRPNVSSFVLSTGGSAYDQNQIGILCIVHCA
jgi:hypothetical protein